MSFEEVLSKREDHPFIVQDKQYTMRAAASTSSPSCDIDCTPKILRMLNSIELELRAECQKAASKSNEAHLSSPQPLTQDTPSIPPPIHGDASVENKSLVSEKSGRDAGPGARRWICPPPCGKSFTREHHLPRHMKSSSCVHNQQKISETLRKRKAEAPRTKPRAGNTSVKGGSAKNSKSSSPRPSSSRGVQDVPLRTLDGKFICVACKMSFSRNDHLKRHQSLSCKAGRGAATPRTRSIRCGPLLKGAISRAHKWLASIDEEGTGGEDRVERLSSSDLGILGLGGCSEDDEAFDCPGCPSQFGKLELIIRHIFTNICQSGIDVAASAKTEEQDSVPPCRTRSLRLKRSRDVSADSRSTSPKKRKTSSERSVEGTHKPGPGSVGGAGTSPSPPATRRTKSAHSQPQRTKNLLIKMRRPAAEVVPEPLSEEMEVNDFESEDETLIDAKYKR